MEVCTSAAASSCRVRACAADRRCSVRWAANSPAFSCADRYSCTSRKVAPCSCSSPRSARLSRSAALRCSSCLQKGSYSSSPAFLSRWTMLVALACPQWQERVFDAAQDGDGLQPRPFHPLLCHCAIRQGHLHGRGCFGWLGALQRVPARHVVHWHCLVCVAHTR